VSALAVDRSGRVVIAGESRSEDLPGAPGAPAGLQDGFVARFAADGAAVEWTRRFGGSREEFVTALDLAPDESIVVGGSSRSAGWLGELAGSEDGFAAIVPGSGEGEVRTFRLGGQGRDRVYGIRVAGSLVAAVGATESAEWLAEGGVGQGQTDAFFATFDPAPPAPLAAASGSAAGGGRQPAVAGRNQTRAAR
jgi:hypothetical protein